MAETVRANLSMKHQIGLCDACIPALHGQAIGLDITKAVLTQIAC